MWSEALKAKLTGAEVMAARQRLADLKWYGLTVLSVCGAVGASLLIQRLQFRVPAAPLLLFVVAISSWYGGRGPGVLGVILSTISFYYYFVEPVHTIYIYASEVPYFIVFTALTLLLSWFGTIRRHAEAVLREQANLLDLTHDTVLVMNLEGVVQYWNRGAEERYGWSAEQAVGRIAYDLLKTVLPAPFEQIKAEVTRTGRWEGEFAHTRRDGTQVIVGSRWAVQRDRKGAAVAILETNNDITERKQAEAALRRSNRELRAISVCNQTLLRATDEQSLLDQICRIACNEAGYRMAWVGYAEQDATRSVRRVASAGAEECYLATAEVSWSEGDEGGLTWTAIHTGQTCCCQDLATDSRMSAWRDEAHRHGFLSAIALPLTDEHANTFGALSVYSSEPHAFTTEEIRLLEELSGDLAFGIVNLRTRIERQRAEEALRENEMRFRTLVDHVADAIFVYDFEQGTIVDVNPQACGSLGYSRQELVGEGWMGFHLDADLSALEAVAQRAAAGETVIDTHWHRRKDGTVFPVEVHTTLILYDGRRLLLMVARDITDRLRAEEAVRQSEKQLRDVIDTIPAYVWSALPDGSLDFLSKRCLEFSGDSFEESLGPGWEHVLHSEDRDRFLNEARAAFATGEPFETEARYRRADGQYRWLLVRAVPLRDEKGTIVKWYGANTDIDDRKRAEEALKRSEAYLADAERLTHTGAWASDGATRPLYWSEAVFRIYGFDPQNGLPDREQPLERVHPEDRDRFSQAFQRTICQKADTDVEYRVLLPDGTLKHVYALAHPVLNSNGDLVEVVGTVVDITERKRAEEECERLHELEADLAHIDRVSMMGELAASIAHEINQPLAGIVSNGGACLRWLTGEEPNLEEAREAVRDIVRDGKRAGEIIARIRAMTKRTAPPRENLDVTETIREVLALLGDEAKRRSVVIRTQFAEDLSNVSGDRVQLQQVVLNLVMNAMDAMSTVVDRERQLVITTQNIAEERVEVTVEDSGIGLDPNTMARIFEPFYTTKSGGMGMGLSISRSILQRHRGSLWATANDGPGTSFHFTLPKYQGEESHAGTAAD